MIRKLRQAAREHKLILVNALLLASLMVAPLVTFPLLVGDAYQGINIANHGFDELWYLSRAREAFDGHHLGNPLWREGKDQTDPFYNYVEPALALPARALGLGEFIDVTLLYAILNTVGVFVLILLIYLFIWQLARDKLLATISTLVVIGGYSLVTPSLFLSINVYSRAMTPYLPSLLTFLYLNFLVPVLRFRSWRNSLAASLVLGSLFYIYFYAWSFILVLNFFLILLAVLKKEWLTLKHLLIVTGLGLALGSYNIINIIVSRTPELARQLDYFHWVEYSHTPALNVIGLVGIFLLAVAWFKIKEDRNLFIFISLILTGWVVINQQIITGRILQFDHYYQQFIIPTLLPVCLYIVWRLLPEISHKKILALALLMFVYFNTGIGQYRATLTNYEAKLYRQQYRPILDYLKKEEPGKSVVLTADDANAYLVTIYTPLDIFWARSFLIVNIPIEERLRETLYVYLYLNSKSRSDIASYLKTALTSEPASFYRNIYETLEGYSSGLPYFDYYQKSANKDPFLLQERERLIAKLAGEYGSLTKESDGVAKLFKKYGLTYILWDRNKYPEWDISFLDTTKVASSKTISLYKIR